MSDFEWYQFHCDRSTFSVTIEQPQADKILAVLEAGRRLRNEMRAASYSETHDELFCAVDDLCAGEAKP